MDRRASRIRVSWNNGDAYCCSGSCTLVWFRTDGSLSCCNGHHGRQRLQYTRRHVKVAAAKHLSWICGNLWQSGEFNKLSVGLKANLLQELSRCCKLKLEHHKLRAGTFLKRAYWLLQIDVMPLVEADIQLDLAKAGVYWELSPLSLSRLRFQVRCTAQWD